MTKKKIPQRAIRIRQETVKTKENELFAILGRYVQEFERVVTTMRNDCIDIVIGEKRGLVVNQDDGLAKLAHNRICSFAFHHQVMTAQPIAEMWCGLTYEQTRADTNLAQETKEVIYGVSNTLTTDFQKIIEKRNRLLHASWNIGPWYKPETFEFQFSVRKFKSGRKGVERSSEVPRNPAELEKELLEVKQLMNRISNFNSFRCYVPERLVKSYAKIKDRWEAR